MLIGASIDTTIAAPNLTTRVHNLGLLANQQVLLNSGVAIFIAGAVFFAAAPLTKIAHDIEALARVAEQLGQPSPRAANPARGNFSGTENVVRAASQNSVTSSGDRLAQQQPESEVEQMIASILRTYGVAISSEDARKLIIARSTGSFSAATDEMLRRS